VSDNPDGRAILASLPARIAPTLEVDLPLAVLPCLRLDGRRVSQSGAWVA